MIEFAANQKLGTEYIGKDWFVPSKVTPHGIDKAIKASWKPDIENIRQVIAKYLWLLYLSQYAHNKALNSSHKSMTSVSSNRLESIQPHS